MYDAGSHRYTNAFGVTCLNSIIQQNTFKYRSGNNIAWLVTFGNQDIQTHIPRVCFDVVNAYFTSFRMISLP